MAFVVLGECIASDCSWSAGLTPDEGDVLVVLHCPGEKLDAVSPFVALLGARACGDGVPQWENLAVAYGGTGIESCGPAPASIWGSGAGSIAFCHASASISAATSGAPSDATAFRCTTETSAAA